jgi:hypothetical protein
MQDFGQAILQDHQRWIQMLSLAIIITNDEYILIRGVHVAM